MVIVATSEGLSGVHLLRKALRAAKAALTSFSALNTELLDLVAQLKERRRITGQPFTPDELLGPKVIGEYLDSFEGGDIEIVGMVQAEVGLARGDIEKIDSDFDPEVVPPSLKEMVEAYRILEENSLVICTEGALELVQAARRYRDLLQRMSRESVKQTTIDMFFNFKSM